MIRVKGAQGPLLELKWLHDLIEQSEMDLIGGRRETLLSCRVGRLPSGLVAGYSAPMRQPHNEVDASEVETGEPGLPPLRTIDLFAGCGGLTQGFVDAKCGGRPVYRPVAAVELDRAAAATYAVNFTEKFGAHIHQGDIADWVDRPGGLPEADIVLGGPPCQGFSRLGNQDPNDARNQLWRHYLDVVSTVRPMAFVMENVDAFRNSPEFELLRREVRDGGALSEYFIYDDLLNAADYGVPQRRFRAIVVGIRKDLRSAVDSARLIDDLTDMELQAALIPTPAAVPERTVWQTISDLVLRKLSSDLPTREVSANGRKIAGPFRMDELHLRRNGIKPISMARYRSIPEGGNRFDIPFELLAPCWKKHKSGSADVMGRLHRDKPSVTIRTEFFKPEKGRYLHPWLHRPITHLEAARLQGFPESFQWCGSRSDIARQIGNAVPVGLGRAIAEHLAPLLLAQRDLQATTTVKAPRPPKRRRKLAAAA
ncbi:DNA cytosine methyltransferase [Streptomyces rochei]|uniref:DNA cytosine methyltransferase n=1 Tax=Streptomyces rochei TaxID=1928 RepID=UPI003683B86D